MYDPLIARWLIPDPARQYFSPYLSMGNNPINRIDPDGGFDDFVLDSNGNLALKQETNDSFHRFFNEDGKLIFATQNYSGAEPCFDCGPMELFSFMEGDFSNLSIALGAAQNKDIVENMIMRANEIGFNAFEIEGKMLMGKQRSLENSLSFLKFLTLLKTL